MRKILPLLSALVALVVAVSACAQPAEKVPTEKPAAPAKTIEWKAVTGWAKGFPLRTLVVETFIERVEKESNGELKISLVGPEAWPTFEQVKALRDGAFDLAFSTPAFYEDLMPGGFAANLAYATPKQRREAGLFAAFDQEYQKKLNAKYLVEWALGAQNHIYTKARVAKLEDFRGLKLRSARGFDPLMVALGSAPTNVSVEETLPALERGVVDGLLFPGFPFMALRYNEYTKYIIYPGLGETLITGMVNLNSWNKLPKHLQDLLQRVAVEEEMEKRAVIADLYDKEVQKMLASGMEKVVLSEPDAKKYLELLVEEYFKNMVMNRSPEFGTQLRQILEKLPKKPS